MAAIRTIGREAGRALKARRLILAVMSLACACAVAALLTVTPPALASLGFRSSTFSATEAPAPGAPFGAVGPADSQAGSHPWAFTVGFTLKAEPSLFSAEPSPAALKDLLVELPPGLVGNTTAIPQCSMQQFTTQPKAINKSSSYFLAGASCPANTQIGIASIEQFSESPKYFDVYNLTPPPGVPAQLGFNGLGLPVVITPKVRSGGDYGLTTAASDLPQVIKVFGSTVTLWGVPADPSHDELRGECLAANGGSIEAEVTAEGRTCSDGERPVPFLTLPTNCTGEPVSATLRADSWEATARENTDGSPVNLAEPSWVSQALTAPALTGCDRLSFAPSIELQPDTSRADTPAGLSVDVRMPEEGLTNPDGLAATDIKNTTVTLPAGVAINPGQAAGLQACQADEAHVGSEAPASCPDASKVGTDSASTPLLRDRLEGDVYVLQSNPPSLELLAVLAGDGVEVKLTLHVHLDETTGRITTTVTSIPQFPVSDFKLSFSGGAQAALVTPLRCGEYQSTADFTPWSTPFGADALPGSAFAITEGAGGSPCPSTPPFSPSLIAGTTTDQAGAFTGFSMLLTRGDGQQRISSLQFKAPPGLAGILAGVPLCPEANANAGNCPPASQIGHTTVTAGPGPNPLVVPEPGQPSAAIYLTGPYAGAPFGLSIVVPVIAGPFNLGTEVVRARIAVDPHTAQLTVTTNPLPPIIKGVPTDLRDIDAVIDRPRFMFNPTNCNPQAFTGTATSTEGVTALISSHFQVGACQSLKFTPDFKVSTSGKTSKTYGASLDARVTYPRPPAGASQLTTQSNIAYVKVDLPKQLPSRLTTLQKACLARVFETNPAACPVGSVVGHATAVTPVLPVPLTGPAYFVSHGGEAFPSLIIVLQGYGVTVDLVAETFINKAGVTTSTFKQVPDVPVTSFDLSLPEGRYSALAAYGDLCKAKLRMPTEFIAQDGAVIHQQTPITTTGCARKHKHKARRGTRRRKR